MNLKQFIPEIKRIAKSKRMQFKDIIVSPLPAKKYRILFNDGTHIDFGSRAHSDFLQHRDEDRRQRFHNRFKSNKGLNDKTSALYFSSRLLW